jgi:hypothetical protein
MRPTSTRPNKKFAASKSGCTGQILNSVHACSRKMKGNCKLDDCSAGKIEQDREKSISRNYHWLQKILSRKIMCALETMSAGGNQNPKQKLFTSRKAQGTETEI